MGSLSDFAENALMGHIFGASYSQPASVFIGLSTADPLDTGAGIAEPSGNNYARATVVFGAAASRKVTQSGVINFSQASGAWGTITHWFICDHVSNVSWGSNVNMLAHGSFSASFAPVAGNTPSIASAQVVVEISASSGEGWTTQLVHWLLDKMFRNQTYAQPATYVALLDGAGADADTTLTTAGKEVGGTGYARVLVNKSGGASPAWGTVAAGTQDNEHDITFPTVGAGGWSQIVGVAIVDGGTLEAGNVLMFDNDQVVDQTPAAGDTVKFLAGALDVTLS